MYTLLTGLMPPFCESTNPEYRPVGSDTTRRWNQDDYPDDGNGAGSVRQCIFVTVSIYLMVKLLG